MNGSGLLRMLRSTGNQPPDVPSSALTTRGHPECRQPSLICNDSLKSTAVHLVLGVHPYSTKTHVEVVLRAELQVRMEG